MVYFVTLKNDHYETTKMAVPEEVSSILVYCFLVATNDILLSK